MGPIPCARPPRSSASARLTQSCETELRRLLAVDLLVIDDFDLDAMDAQESRDAYEILTERRRFTSDADDLVMDGESYRARLKPRVRPGQPAAKRGIRCPWRWTDHLTPVSPPSRGS